jgi:signal transduction histidine kinase
MALMADTVALFQQADGSRGIVVVVQDVPDLRPALIDPKQIHQVLWNLLQNASQAMEGSGRIDVRVQADPGGDSFVIAVGDQGPGVACPSAVFEPFYTTRAQGTGLGLAVVTRIIGDHGGRVWAENQPAGGACVMFELPFGCAPACTGQAAG